MVTFAGITGKVRPESTPFERAPQYWRFLKEKADAGVIGSPELVLDKELTGSDPSKADSLELWAKPLRGVLFLPSDSATQHRYRDTARWVQTNGRFKQHHIDTFLAKADGWLVAYAQARGGQIVTFETPQPQSTKPKIPDVAQQFGVTCLNVWDMLNALNFRL